MALHERGEEDFIEILRIKTNDFPPSRRRLTKASSGTFSRRQRAQLGHDRDCERRYVLKICAVHTKAAAAEVRTLPERFIDHVLMEIRKFRRPINRLEGSLTRVVAQQSNVAGGYNFGSE